MSDNSLPTRAKAMRRAMTAAEAVLWNILRNEPLKHWHFRRQVAFPPRYIADFCSHKARLIVEADGEGHVLGHAANAARDRWFAGQGYRVVRFENRHLLVERDAVFAALCDLATSSQPSGLIPQSLVSPTA
jgi:very-short-patch-repair endonuclease